MSLTIMIKLKNKEKEKDYRTLNIAYTVKMVICIMLHKVL